MVVLENEKVLKGPKDGNDEFTPVHDKFYDEQIPYIKGNGEHCLLRDGK
jgi:hypothetical protein